MTKSVNVPGEIEFAEMGATVAQIEDFEQSYRPLVQHSKLKISNRRLLCVQVKSLGSHKE